MQRTSGIYTTVDQLNALDLTDPNSNRWRIPLWEQMPEDIKMRRVENDLVLLDILNGPAMATKVKEWNQPVIRWNVDEAMNLWTKVAANAVFVGETSVAVTVDDNMVVRVGNGVFFPETNQVHLVSAVSAAGVSPQTMTVNLTAMGGEIANVTAGQTVMVLPPYMGEKSEAREITSVLPGEPQFNYIAVAAHYFEITKMQAAANMFSGEGAGFATIPRAEQEAIFKMRLMIQNALMFQNRTTYAHATEGQVYIGGSLASQIKSYQLDASGVGDTLLYGNINDFLIQTFESENSSNHKIAPCGRSLWSNVLKTADDAGKILGVGGNNTYMHPTLGARSFDLETTDGDTVTFIRDKGSLVKSIGDWGFVVDPANISRGQYAGLGPQWFDNLQDNSAIMIEKKAAYLESFAINVLDEQTCGIFKGGSKPLI